MWKSPFVDIGAVMISDATLEELRKGMEEVHHKIKDELKIWDSKVTEGKDLTKNLLLAQNELKDLKSHKEAIERSIKSLEDRLSQNRKAKEKAVADTQRKLSET